MTSAEFETNVDELTSAIGTLVRRLRFEASAHELSLTQRAVLARLSRDGAMTTSDLARAEGMKPQSMSVTVANLEEQKLVERQPHPTDKRQTNITLTDEGRTIHAEMRAARRSWLGEAITKLSEKDQMILFEAGSIIRRLGEQ